MVAGTSYAQRRGVEPLHGRLTWQTPTASIPCGWRRDRTHAVDMWGMSQYDAPFLWLALRGDLSDFVTIPDRTHQGVLNHLVVMKLMRGAFVNDPNVVFDGSSVLDPARVHLWGISQGGVLVGSRLARTSQKRPHGGPKLSPRRWERAGLARSRAKGTVVVAVSQDIERAHIGVPGRARRSPCRACCTAPLPRPRSHGSRRTRARWAEPAVPPCMQAIRFRC